MSCTNVEENDELCIDDLETRISPHLDLDNESLFENNTDYDDGTILSIELDAEAHGTSENFPSTSASVPKSEKRKKTGRPIKYGGLTREERKMRSNLNEFYISENGKEVHPKVFDEKFQCKCERKCTEKVSLEKRKKIFSQYWSMGSYEGRCALVQSWVTNVPVKRHYKNKDKTKQSKSKQNNRIYKFAGVQICKSAFLKTLQINGSRVDNSLKKLDAYTLKDNRGLKCGGLNAFPEWKLQQVIDHISSFSRYNKPNGGSISPNGRYIDGNLTFPKMYKLYVEEYSEQPVSLSSYKKTFYTKTNFLFQKLRKSQKSKRKNDSTSDDKIQARKKSKKFTEIDDETTFDTSCYDDFEFKYF